MDALDGNSSTKFNKNLNESMEKRQQCDGSALEHRWNSLEKGFQ